jgi:lysophospholipase L1-like esterase
MRSGGGLVDPRRETTRITRVRKMNNSAEQNASSGTPARRSRWLRRAVRIAALALVYLLVFDAVAWLGLWLAHDRESPYADPAILYPGASWAPELLDETARLSVEWQPYCYWRVAPVAGRYVNVDAQGLRQTWNHGTPRVTGANQRVHRIFMFGGSAMFGIDARDDYTIPSLFAKDLQRGEIENVETVNYGQVGYVSTQEVASLMLALRAGERPDLIVFYDGFNDANVAFRERQAGVTEGERHRALEFNLLNHVMPQRRRALYRAALETLLTESSLGIVARMLLRRYAPAFYRRTGGALQIANLPPTGADPRLAAAVVEDYLRNMQAVAVTGAARGIPVLFYWQPVLTLKSPRSPLEGRLAQESEREMPGRDRFVSQVYEQLHAVLTAPGYRGPRVTDLSTILNGQPSCFADDAHIVEGCNAVIASRIAADAIPILRDLAARERSLRWTPVPGG